MYPIVYIFGRPIGVYGLCLVLAIGLSAFLSIKRGRQFGVIREDILIVGATAIGAALVCGSLMYCVISFSPQILWEQLKALNLKFFFASGIVFYGGLLGALAGALLGIFIAKCSFFDLERSVVPFVPLGHAIGRIGCLMGGCCYGIPYDGLLAVYYSNSLTGLSPEQGYFPVQPLEAVINCAMCFVLLCCSKKVKRPLDLLCAYLGLYSVSRFFLEFLRGDENRGLYGGLSTSQWLSIFLLAFCCIRWISTVKRCGFKKTT